MDKVTPLTVHQCYFGEMNRGHGLICASFDNKGLTTFLSRVTDMPISKPANVQPDPFYGCHSNGNFTIFTKTFLDQQTSRSGMVFTHAIILETKFLVQLDNLQKIFSLFVHQIPEIKPVSLQSLIITNTSSQPVLTKESQDKLFPILNFFLSSNSDQYLVIPLDNQMSDLYMSLWDTIIPQLRCLLTFRLSFNPNDIQTEDYRLYFSPTMLLSRWPPQLLYDNYKASNTQVPLAAKFLLQLEEGDPLSLFVQELNYKITDFKGLQLCEIAFAYYSQITDINTNSLLQLIRLVLLLAPLKTSATRIKSAIEIKLIQQLDQSQTDDFLLLSLANIEFKGMDTFPSELSIRITKILSSWWRNEETGLLQETLARRLGSQESSWWITAIDASFEHQLKDISATDSQTIWALSQQDEKVATYLWNFIGSAKSTEQRLIASQPRKLDKRIIEQLLPVIKKQRWYQLHACLISKYLLPPFALKEQIALTSSDKMSLVIIAKQFIPGEFIQTAFKYKIHLLDEIALELPVRLTDLEQYIELDQSEWQEFLLAKLNQAVKPKLDISGFGSIMSLILDRLVDGKPVQDNLLAAFAETPLADLSSYHQRTQVWRKLPVTVINKFLMSTGRSLIELLTTTADLEPELKEAMFSLNIAGDYMHDHAQNWSDILRIFEMFPTLPEKYLSDHLSYSKQIDTSTNSIRLGKIIDRNKWRNCASDVYEKARYDDNFKPALSQCLNLLDVFKKLKVQYRFSNMPKTCSITESDWLMQYEALCNEIYDEETEIRIIYKKAGGDTSDLKSKESARVIWQHTLKSLHKGKIKGLTFKRLIQEMMNDAPGKREQLEMLLLALNDIPTIT